MNKSLAYTVTDSDRLWAACLIQKEQSGMTVREWCITNGCSVSTYYRHKARLARFAEMGIIVDPIAPDDPDSEKDPAVLENEPEMTAAAAPEATPSGFVKVEVGTQVVEKTQMTTTVVRSETTTSPPPALRIHHRGDVIEISNNASPAILSMIKEVLLHA